MLLYILSISIICSKQTFQMRHFHFIIQVQFCYGTNLFLIKKEIEKDIKIHLKFALIDKKRPNAKALMKPFYKCVQKNILLLLIFMVH